MVNNEAQEFQLFPIRKYSSIEYAAKFACSARLIKKSTHDFTWIVNECVDIFIETQQCA